MSNVWRSVNGKAQPKSVSRIALGYCLLPCDSRRRDGKIIGEQAPPKRFLYYCTRREAGGDGIFTPYRLGPIM